jgi:hypothetical protein
MAGTAPTDFDVTKTLNAGPVHCSVWLSHSIRDTISSHNSAPSIAIRLSFVALQSDPFTPSLAPR